MDVESDNVVVVAVAVVVVVVVDTREIDEEPDVVREIDVDIGGCDEEVEVDALFVVGTGLEVAEPTAMKSHNS